MPTQHPAQAPECERAIKLLVKCYEDHPVTKYFGKCNKFGREVKRCVLNAHEENRKKNLSKKAEKKHQEVS